MGPSEASSHLKGSEVAAVRTGVSQKDFLMGTGAEVFEGDPGTQILLLPF